MANTRPFTEAHAIAWVDVAVIFEDKLSTDQQEDLRVAFAAILTDEGFSAAEPGDGGEVAFERKGLGGEITEEVHIHRGYVHAMWNEYRGWTHTRDATIRRMGPVIERVRDGRLEAMGIGMAFRDVFLNETPDEYDMLDVFRPGSRFLPAIAFESGEVWKQSSNWVADTTYSSLAIQAKIAFSEESDDSDDDDDGMHVTEILHRQSTYGNEDADPSVEWSEDVVRERLNKLHQQNKDVMLELLSDEMISKIGLKE